MESLDKKQVEIIIKKHVGFAMFLSIVPISFIKFATYFSGSDDSLLVYLIPITTVGACSHFIKSVLTDIFEVNEVAHNKPIK